MILIVDGSHMLHRSMFAMKDLDSWEALVFQFFRIIKKVTKKYDNIFDIIVCWDKGKSYRNEMSKDYKHWKNRDWDEISEEDKKQIKKYTNARKYLHNNLHILGIKSIMVKNLEADDIGYFLSKNGNFREFKKLFVTEDKDWMQMVGFNSKLFRPIQNIIIDRNTLLKDYNVKDLDEFITKFIFLKSIEGDSSDGLDGIKGIGEKRGLELYKKLFNENNEMIPDEFEKLSNSNKKYERKFHEEFEKYKRNVRLIYLYNSYKRIVNDDFGIDIIFDTIGDVFKEVHVPTNKEFLKFQQDIKSQQFIFMYDGWVDTIKNINSNKKVAKLQRTI